MMSPFSLYSILTLCETLHPHFHLQVSIESDGDFHGATVLFLELACNSSNNI